MIIFPYRCRINSRDTLWWPDLSSEFLRRLFFLLFPVFSCFCFFSACLKPMHRSQWFLHEICLKWRYHASWHVYLAWLRSSFILCFLRCFADCEIQNGKCKERRYHFKTLQMFEISEQKRLLQLYIPSCHRSGGACTAEGAHKTPRPSGWRLLRFKTGASSLHYSVYTDFSGGTDGEAI